MSDVNVRVARQEAIEQYTEQLVQTAGETLSESRVEKLKGILKPTQLNNFLGVALATPSVAAIKNWVRYQMGRPDTSRAWTTDGFGEAVLEDVGTMKQWAEEIAFRLLEEEEEARKEVPALHVALVRLYAGYLKRWFVARGGQQ